MPKIIENLRERLMEEARRQLEEAGYGALTMRGVAQAVGVGVGTVYNYYPSKDHLIASFMAEDWFRAYESMQRAFSGGDPKTILAAEYDGLSAYLSAHRRLFSDPDAIKAFSSLPHNRHLQLRAQLAKPLTEALSDRPDAAFRAELLAEALLCWTTEGAAKETLLGVLDDLL